MKNKISPVYFIMLNILNDYKNKNKEFSFQDLLEKIKEELSKKGIEDSPVFIGPSYTIHDYLELLKLIGIIEESFRNTYKFRSSSFSVNKCA